MHVLILPSWYFPSGSKEIAGQMFLHLAQDLREKGLDARILHIDFSPLGSLKKKSFKGIESGVPTWRTSHWFPPKSNSILFKAWINTCTKEIEIYIRDAGKPDLIHAQSYLMASVCAALQKKSNIPFVYTERLSKFITGNIPKFHYPFIRNSFSLASVCTSVSPGLRNYLKTYTDRNIEVVPNYFDSRVFFPGNNEYKNGHFTWVSIGEPAYTKGLDLLLPAFASLKRKLNREDMRLVLIDRIPEEIELKRMAKKLNIERDITWAGLIPQEQIGTILRQSHVFISASRVETFGKAILEAQACGIPVIATKTDGAQYILYSEAQGILAEINNQDALSSAMEKVYLNYSEYDPHHIHKHVAEKFSKEIIITQWIKLYESVLT